GTRRRPGGTAPGYPCPIRRMAMRAGSFAELELVCVFTLHGTGMLCKTLPAQPHPGVLSASRSHAKRPCQQACEMRNDFHTRLHGSPRATRGSLPGKCTA